MRTRELENAIFNKLCKTGTYLCFEVMMPGKYRGCVPQERVDLLQYDTKGDWRFYELKVTKQDFYSKNSCTFKGHYNYFVLPKELYEKVKKDIPRGIGVYIVSHSNENNRIICECAEKPIRQYLAVDEEKLKFSFMQALSREHEKYRRLLIYNNTKGGEDREETNERQRYDCYLIDAKQSGAIPLTFDRWLETQKKEPCEYCNGKSDKYILESKGECAVDVFISYLDDSLTIEHQTGIDSAVINFCPMCGRELKKTEV